jgi:arylsulfatase A-like enzyme
MASAIVLVVDRLGAGHLGPYGNTWLETPQFNRLAARSLLCETVFADSPDLSAACRAYWTGRGAHEPALSDLLNLPAQAARAGASTLLVTDDESVASDPLAASFGECELIASPPTESGPADTIEQTGMFRLITAALAAIERSRDPLLAWIHARGMSAAWDAPREYRERLADPEDPAPPDFRQPPDRRLPKSFDPDEVLGVVQAYAAQVHVLDECLGLLLDALAQREEHQEVLLACTSPRGCPLGEHGRIGPCDGALYSELLQVPLLIQFPHAREPIRTQRLVQPSDLFATILESCGWGVLSPAEHAASLLRVVHGYETPPRLAACAFAPQQRAIRTPAWLLRESEGENGVRHELFAKPDDRWDANEVSSRCGEIPALLAAELDRYEQAAAAGQLAELAPLAEILTDAWH